MQNKTYGILNGPNLARLGKRETSVYGNSTLKDLENLLLKEAQTLNVSLQFFQSNHEGALIDTLEKWTDQGFHGIVFNPGAYTHTSIALRDAIAGISPLPVIEVHISNIFARESFRHTSLISPVCKGTISGLGFQGYTLALQFLIKNS